jgi:hypothetical protein
VNHIQSSLNNRVIPAATNCAATTPAATEAFNRSVMRGRVNRLRFLPTFE